VSIFESFYTSILFQYKVSEKKKASINFEEAAEKQLDQISASDFLAALDAGGLSPRNLTVWPEKKKVELLAEPENFSGLRVRDVLDVLRNEKKKLEIEWHKPPGPEGQIDPRFHYEVIFEDLVDRVARNVEARLRSRPSF
jgi:hypothetical protein